jgi:hypothetical protein
LGGRRNTRECQSLKEGNFVVKVCEFHVSSNVFFCEFHVSCFFKCFFGGAVAERSEALVSTDLKVSRRRWIETPLRPLLSSGRTTGMISLAILAMDIYCTALHEAVYDGPSKLWTTAYYQTPLRQACPLNT